MGFVVISDRIERGFDFLGYHFSRTGLTVAKATIEKFVERAPRLYEQDWKEPSGPSRLGMYVRRWVAWSGAGVGEAKSWPCPQPPLAASDSGMVAPTFNAQRATGKDEDPPDPMP